MKKKLMFSCKFVIVLFFGVSHCSNGSEQRVLNPDHAEAPVTSMPSPYVLTSCTLTEALNSFFEWYKNAYPPMAQTISVVVTDNGSRSRMVDLSDPGMDPFSDNRQSSECKIKRTIDLSGIHVDDVIHRIASAYGLSSRFYNGMYHINDSNIATRGVAVGAEQKLSPTSYLAPFLASNVVAAVVGYETTRQLAGGVTVPLFSVELSSSKSVHGVLFKIIAPSRYADQFFWIKNTACDEWTLPTNLYNIDLLYSFKLDTKPGMFGCISKSEFFSIPAQKHFSSTTWSKGVPFIKDTNDIMIVRTHIDKHVMALSNEVKQSFTRLKLIKKDTEEYNSQKEMHDIDVKKVKSVRERYKKMLENANERLESNQQMLNLLFPAETQNSSATETNK